MRRLQYRLFFFISIAPWAHAGMIDDMNLTIHMPSGFQGKHACVFKIEGRE